MRKKVSIIPSLLPKKNGTEATSNGHAADVESSANTTVLPSLPSRDNWGNDIEFLMSCIAMSVGLGNVWRFPFTALENGGGAFLIPYLIVLAIVGRPIYYLEMVVGQFSSRGSAKVYDLCPALRGEFMYAIRCVVCFLMLYFYAKCEDN